MNQSAHLLRFWNYLEKALLQVKLSLLSPFNLTCDRVLKQFLVRPPLINENQGVVFIMCDVCMVCVSSMDMKCQCCVWNYGMAHTGSCLLVNPSYQNM